MPADKQSAFAALDGAFADAVKAAFNEMIMLLAGRDAPRDVEVARVETMLRNAVSADKELRALIEKVLP